MGKKTKERTKSIASSSKNGAKAHAPTFPPHLLKPKLKSSHLELQVLHPGAVFVARNFLDPDECKAWIDFIESTGLEQVAHPATRWIAHRECGRFQRTDWDMAKRLYERMVPLINKVAAQVDISSSHSYRPVACNGNLRLYKYEKGMSFGKHVDDSEKISGMGQTEMTVLVYLSDCVGGATRFYPPVKKLKNGFGFTPEAGAILLHVHGDRCLEHEADPVEHGVKYILRTDVVYGTV